MAKGEDQAQKLVDALKGSLGKSVEIQRNVEKFPQDIRDRGETMNESENVNSISSALGGTNDSRIKVSMYQ